MGKNKKKQSLLLSPEELGRAAFLTSSTVSPTETSKPTPALDPMASTANFIFEVLTKSTPPPLPEHFVEHEPVKNLFLLCLQLREAINSFAKGNIDAPVAIKGYVGGALKALQANLRHLAWQTEQITQGDFSQRIEFMGDFSNAFNSMTEQLATTLKTLHEKEQHFILLTDDLRAEVTSRIQIAESLKKSEESYRQLASIDPLTSLYNRRHFFAAAAKELERASRNKHPLCLAMLDVDQFKVFNDTYGHQHGDFALSHMARILLDNLRLSDIVARYGGEEFIILLPETDLEAGAASLDRLRAIINNTAVPSREGIPESCITVSIGVTSLKVLSVEGHPRLLDQAIHQADAALYAAKVSGRNKLRTAPPLSTQL